MTAGYILSGGKNRRMDERKKLFLEYQGEPFYKHILRAFSVLPAVYLSVDNPAPYASLHLPMVLDEYADIGPLGGIYSGLKACNEDSLFVTACDMPLFDQTDICQVLDVYHKAQQITIVHEDGQLHPLFGIYPKSVLPLLEQMIVEKNYRMQNLFHLTTPTLVTLHHHHALSNINTKEQYTKLKGTQPCLNWKQQDNN